MIIKKVYKGLTPFVKGYKGTTVIFEDGGLPSQYQQVEYIQSISNLKGDNYIDTGYYPNENTCIRFSFMFDSTHPLDDYGRLMGGYNDSFRLEGMSSYSGMSWTLNGLIGINISLNFMADTLYTAEISDGVYINGSQQFSGTMNPDSNNRNTSILLFSSNGGDRDGAYKLYSCQIEENGVLVRDFVPCFIKATDESGLYDLVTKQFYHNLGTVPFTHPTPIPSPYTRIEYIQTSGTQYIDTGIQPTLDTSMELGVYMLEETGDTVVGNTLGGGERDNHDWHIFNYSGSVLWDCAENRAWTGTFSPNQYYDFECGNNYVIQDGNEIYRGSDSTWSIDTFNILIFGQNCIFNNSQHYDTELNMAFSIGRIYYLKIYEDGTLVRNLIPVRNGQVGGMYDTVSGQFFGNEGSGDFILGGDI